MRKLILLFGISLLPTVSFGQGYQTILGSGRVEYSGFGGPMFNFTSIGDDFAFMSGGGGAVLLNDKFFMGGYGWGTSNEPRTPDTSQKISMSEGGLWMGLNFKANRPIHISTSVLAGWGDFKVHDGNTPTDKIFAVTPMVEAEANITRFMRLAVGLNYRIVSGFEGTGWLGKSDLSRPGMHLSMKFGWFGRGW